ncbi:hypothetical protein UY3_08327 [Chelonia mydas]|uniref:Uncharacterized protein n=1 Tax=Chelonia mydas TaxID=8469 RepID=M7BQY0_CHEMY|nr:hypothetical protein UY3_08327 [Chelonia mydas]
MKIKELRQAYQKAKEANGRSGSEPQTSCFYDQLYTVLGTGDPTTTPPLSMDTCKVAASCNTEEDFVNEEEEEYVQQATGKICSPQQLGPFPHPGPNTLPECIVPGP